MRTFALDLCFLGGSVACSLAAWAVVLGIVAAVALGIALLTGEFR